MNTGSQGYPSGFEHSSVAFSTPRFTAVVGSRATTVCEPSQGGSQQLSANRVGCHGSPDHCFGPRPLTASN